MTASSFDDRDGMIWLNGDLVDLRDAKVHILSHALHYASSVFEGVRSYGGNVFKLTEHSQRLINSAALLGFEIPYTLEEINAACVETCKANNIVDGYLRPLAWRGSEMMAISAQATTIHFSVATWTWPSYFTPEARMKGIRLKTGPWKRPSAETEPVHAKAAGLYMICTLSKHEAESQGYTDSLMLDNQGNIAEATGANIFFKNDANEIHTPIPDSFLDGITRRCVIEIAKSKGIKVIERKIKQEEMSDFVGCFLTGTAAEVTPVSSIDKNEFKVCDVIKELSETYQGLVRKKKNAA